MRIVISYLWVAFGGALGSMARFWCSGLVAQTVGGTFPWGTMMVNVVGSFIIGFFGTLTGADGRLLVSPDIRTFVMVGFCGGYTTFSSFSLQTLGLARDGEWLQVSANVLLSVALCLLSVWLGHVAAASLSELPGG
jgi:CrcB protein